MTNLIILAFTSYADLQNAKRLNFYKKKKNYPRKARILQQSVTILIENIPLRNKSFRMYEMVLFYHEQNRNHAHSHTFTRIRRFFIQTYLSYMSLSTDLFIYMRCFFGPLSFSILKRKMTCTQLEAVHGTAAPVGARILPFLYGKWVHRTHEEKQPCKFSLHVHCTGRMSC